MSEKKSLWKTKWPCISHVILFICHLCSAIWGILSTCYFIFFLHRFILHQQKVYCGFSLNDVSPRPVNVVVKRANNSIAVEKHNELKRIQNVILSLTATILVNFNEQKTGSIACQLKRRQRTNGNAISTFTLHQECCAFKIITRIMDICLR